MTQPAEAAPTPAAAPTSNHGTFEQRFAQVKAEVMAESPEPAADALPSTPAAPSSAPTEVPAAASADAATERRARLQALAERERQHVDQRTRETEHQKLMHAFEQERQARLQLEQRLGTMVDPSELDEPRFYELAKRAKVDPVKFGEWIRESIANPEGMAARTALKTLDPEIAALKSQLAQQSQAIQQFMAQQAHERQQAQEREATTQFYGFVKESAEKAPLASSLLTRLGEKEFMQVAVAVGQALPESAGPQALLDAIEEYLESTGRPYAQQLAEIYGLKPEAAKPALAPKNAAAKAKTVSNALAQERASVVQEEEWAKLPYAERLRLMKL